MSGKHLFIITDDVPWACLAVFGIGLYGLPEWADIVDRPEDIDAIPGGSRYRACWRFETSASRYMQRLVTERWAARELIAASEEFMGKIETMIAERDARELALARGAAEAANAAREAAPQEDIPQKRASKWH